MKEEELLRIASLYDWSNDKVMGTVFYEVFGKLVEKKVENVYQYKREIKEVLKKNYGDSNVPMTPKRGNPMENLLSRIRDMKKTICFDSLDEADKDAETNARDLKVDQSDKKKFLAEKTPVSVKTKLRILPERSTRNPNPNYSNNSRKVIKPMTTVQKKENNTMKSAFATAPNNKILKVRAPSKERRQKIEDKAQQAEKQRLEIISEKAQRAKCEREERLHRFQQNHRAIQEENRNREEKIRERTKSPFLNCSRIVPDTPMNKMSSKSPLYHSSALSKKSRVSLVTTPAILRYSSTSPADTESSKTDMPIRETVIPGTNQAKGIVLHISNEVIDETPVSSQKKALQVQDSVPNDATYTPSSCNLKKFIPSTTENYFVDDLDSNDSTDDEEHPRKVIPLWARPFALQASCIAVNKLVNMEQKQCHFGQIKYPVLGEIFSSHVDPRKLPLKRHSSADWNSPLTDPRVGHSHFKKFLTNKNR